MFKTAEMEAQKAESTSKLRILEWVTKRYTRQGLWSLFLMCAFPLHAWTLILAFRDVSWVTDRTNAWDAVGVVSYGLIFAFAESLILFAIMALLGYLVATHWDSDRRVTLLTVLVLVVSLWAMLEQLFFLAGVELPGWLIALLVRSGHPLWLIYGILLALLGITLLAPAVLVMRFKRGYAAVRGLIDRLSVLTMFYLVLDILALIIVIVRNV